MLVDFDPRIHRGLPLYERRSEEGTAGAVATVVVPSEASFEIASKTPWYFMARVADDTEEEQGVR